MMLKLEDRFTSLQAQKLRKAGLRSLYEFITYLPLGAFWVVPMSQFGQAQPDSTKFLDQAVLEKITHRKTKQAFLQLEWRSQITSQRYQTYFFSVARYTLQTLKVGQEFQLLLVNRNGFWNLERFAEFTGLQESEQLRLGKSNIRKYLEVYYQKLGPLQSNYFKILHSRLHPKDYLLNLTGLVPQNTIIPQIIDLVGVHRPKTVEEYQKTWHQWISLQVYLKLALSRFVSQKQEQEFGRAAHLDLDFLKDISKTLPFELSVSQKQAIWSILQEVSVS